MLLHVCYFFIGPYLAVHHINKRHELPRAAVWANKPRYRIQEALLGLFYLISCFQPQTQQLLNTTWDEKKNRYDVPVPVCFKEFSATYYRICSNIYGIKSFILNNPILYVFLCVNKLTTELGLTCPRCTLTS